MEIKPCYVVTQQNRGTKERARAVKCHSDFFKVKVCRSAVVMDKIRLLAEEDVCDVTLDGGVSRNDKNGRREKLLSSISCCQIVSQGGGRTAE